MEWDDLALVSGLVLGESTFQQDEVAVHPTRQKRM